MAAGVRGAINSGETRPTATEGGGEGSSDRRGRNRLGHKATIIYRERCANVFHRRWKRRGRSIKPGPFVLAAFVLRFAPPAGYSSLLARRGSASNRRFILLESIARDVSRRRFFRSRFFFFLKFLIVVLLLLFSFQIFGSYARLIGTSVLRVWRSKCYRNEGKTVMTRFDDFFRRKRLDFQLEFYYSSAIYRTRCVRTVRVHITALLRELLLTSSVQLAKRV